MQYPGSNVESINLTMSSLEFLINGSKTIKQLDIIASIYSYYYSLYISGYSEILYNLVFSIFNRNKYF